VTRQIPSTTHIGIPQVLIAVLGLPARISDDYVDPKRQGQHREAWPGGAHVAGM
jgi:hypothetical protein